MNEETKEIENQEPTNTETPQEEVQLVESPEPEEQPQEEQPQEEQQLSPTEIRQQRVEERAKSGGWTPLEDYKGDPADWKTADQFNRDGEMYGRISASQKKMLFQVEEKLKGISEQLQGQSKQTNEDKVAYLTQMKREAYQGGDIAQGEKIEEEIYKLKESSPQQSKTKENKEGEFSPAIHSFVGRNKDWFNDVNPENASMSHYAQRKDEELARQFPHWTEERRLQETERHVKQFYSHRFDADRQAASTSSSYRAPSVTTQSTTVSAAKRKYSLDKYSYEDRRAIKNMAVEAKMSVEDYLKELEE